MRAGMPAASCVAIFVAFLAFQAFAEDAPAPAPKPVKITADTQWSGEVSVESDVQVDSGTLTVAPGTKVTLKPAGKIIVGANGALVAKGTAEKPVEITGDGCGLIKTVRGKMELERCRITGVRNTSGNRSLMLDALVGKPGVAIRDCRIESCGGMYASFDGGAFEVSGCDIRKGDPGENNGISTYGAGSLLFERNTVEGTSVGAGSGADAVIRENVIIDGTLSAWKPAKLLAERNYVHRPKPGGTYATRTLTGVTRDNVFRGGSWVSAQMGGELVGNVLISLPHENIGGPGDYDKSCTHEHICGLAPNSRVERNIFVGASYGAVMGIGDGTCSDSVIRNNTFDSRDRGNAIYLNHLPKSNPKGIVVKNNIFMRCGPVYSESDVPDSTSLVDFNLWSGGKSKERFKNLKMAGKSPGDPGMGGRDVPPADKDPLPPASVVANPDIAFPFTDEEMLARKHKVEEVLKAYRDAYTPVKGSAAIDAGDPADKDDPAVKDGRPDIGAIERTN